MKRIITIVCLLVSSLSYGQIRYNQMPDLDSLAVGDYVPIFRPPYDQGKAKFSTLIDLIGAGTGVDSIWRVAGRDSIFFKKSGITYKIKDSVGTGGGGVTWGSITGALEDQADLNDALFERVRYADTSLMLLPYLRKVDTVSLSNRINAKLGASDTVSLSSRINLKLNAADTASLSTRINTKLNSSDTASLSSRIDLRVRYTDTATMLTPYLRKTDTASMLTPYLRSNIAAATYATTSQNALKVNISDTASMLSTYLRSLNASATYATIAQNGSKADTTLRPAMYAKYLPADTSTSNTTATGTGLLFPIAANEVWQVFITGTCAKASTTTGLKLAIGAPTGAVIKGIQQQGITAQSTAMQNSLISAINSLGATFANAAGVEFLFRQEFIIENGANAGNVELQFATVTSNAATIYKYTKLTAIRNKN